MKPFSLEEYLSNPNRKIVTRDGKSARIICTDRKGATPIIALVNSGLSGELCYSLYPDGKKYEYSECSTDLFFAPEKHEGWINIYTDINDNSHPGYPIFKSKEEAEEDGKKWSGYVTTIKIEWEE